MGIRPNQTLHLPVSASSPHFESKQAAETLMEGDGALSFISGTEQVK